MSANGSRDVGIFVSSSAVKFVAVPVARVSTTGDSPLTVIVSDTDATRSVMGRSTLLPTATMTFSRTTVEKPGSVAVIVYGPGARFRNRYSPPASVVNVSVASTPCAETVTPGSTPPCSSLMTPLMVPPWICANADTANVRHHAATTARVPNRFIRVFLLRTDRRSEEHVTCRVGIDVRTVFALTGAGKYQGVTPPVKKRDALFLDAVIQKDSARWSARL